MKNTIRLKILFLVGVFVFIGRNAYAYGYFMGINMPNKYILPLVGVWVALAIIFFGIIFKAMKERETNKAPNEGAKSDESVRNFKKHYDEKTKQ